MTMQSRRDDVTYQNIIALSKDGAETQEKTAALVTSEVGRMEELMAAFRQEVRHRFELQSAENKRLNQHVVALKAENRQLSSDLVSVYTVNIGRVLFMSFRVLFMCCVCVCRCLLWSAWPWSRQSSQMTRPATRRGERHKGRKERVYVARICICRCGKGGSVAWRIATVEDKRTVRTASSKQACMQDACSTIKEQRSRAMNIVFFFLSVMLMISLWEQRNIIYEC
jgi:hypothetical protein